MSDKISPEEIGKIKKYFELELKDISLEKLEDLRKQARKKYHPDKFSHLEDEVVIDMAKERFQEIERLANKLQTYLESGRSLDDILEAQQKDWKPDGRYASEGMKIDIMTSDKTLKYQLFRTRIIYRGDKATIPGTGAKLYAMENYSGASSGFRENIKVLLTFREEDSITDIVHWLFRTISGRTSSFVIEGKVVKIDPYEMIQAIRKEARLELGK